MVTKFLDFIHKHPNLKVVKSFFHVTFFRNLAKTDTKLGIFGIENHKIDFFITKSSNFISNLNEDCSQLSFEVYNVFVAQKMQISEFLIEFYFAWTLPLRRPPEAAISTSATFIGYQILAE